MSGNLTRLSAACAPGSRLYRSWAHLKPTLTGGSRSSNREFRAPPFRGEDEGPHSLCDIAEEEPKLVTLRRSTDRNQPTIWAGRNK
jgi:hypothetical protein